MSVTLISRARRPSLVMSRLQGESTAAAAAYSALLGASLARNWPLAEPDSFSSLSPLTFPRRASCVRFASCIQPRAPKTMRGSRDIALVRSRRARRKIKARLAPTCLYMQRGLRFFEIAGEGIDFIFRTRTDAISDESKGARSRRASAGLAQRLSLCAAPIGIGKISTRAQRRAPLHSRVSQHRDLLSN